MAIPLTVQIETVVRDALFNKLAISGATPTAELLPEQRVREVTRGYLLLQEDIGRGAIIRLEMASGAKVRSEFGIPELRDLLKRDILTITGVTKTYPTAQEAVDACALLEALALHIVTGLTISSEVTYTGIGEEHVSWLEWLDHAFRLETFTGSSQAPKVESPVAAGGNTSTGTVRSRQNPTYKGQADSTFTIEIVTANTAPGAIAGMTWRWKRDNGAWSSQIVGNTAYVQLADSVEIAFALSAGQNFVAGNQWTVAAKVSGADYARVFIQTYEINTEHRSEVS